jgi:hypothetical protein
MEIGKEWENLQNNLRNVANERLVNIKRWHHREHLEICVEKIKHLVKDKKIAFKKWLF